jgi:hypothetical protein
VVNVAGMSAGQLDSSIDDPSINPLYYIIALERYLAFGKSLHLGYGK